MRCQPWELDLRISDVKYNTSIISRRFSIMWYHSSRVGLIGLKHGSPTHRTDKEVDLFCAPEFRGTLVFYIPVYRLSFKLKTVTKRDSKDTLPFNKINNDDHIK